MIAEIGGLLCLVGREQTMQPRNGADLHFNGVQQQGNIDGIGFRLAAGELRTLEADVACKKSEVIGNTMVGLGDRVKLTRELDCSSLASIRCITLALGSGKSAACSTMAVARNGEGGAAYPDPCPTVATTSLPACGCGEMTRIGEDVSERLDVIPAQFRVLVTRRPKYACRRCS